MTREQLVEIARSAQEICARHDARFHCDASDALESRLADLYPTNPPKEGQVVLTLTAFSEEALATVELVKELEAIPEVWRVYQGHHPIHDSC